MENITFFWNEKKYEVDARAYSVNCIVLPNGIVLAANGWFESLPPQPNGLHEVPCLFSSLGAEEVARHINGVVAREISS